MTYQALTLNLVEPLNKMLPKILYWTSRVVGLLSIGFISLFALDVFSADDNLAQTLVALTMHLSRRLRQIVDHHSAIVHY